MFQTQTYIQRRNALKSKLKNGIVLLLGNNETAMNYTANPYHFRQDSNFLYFFGLDALKYRKVYLWLKYLYLHRVLLFSLVHLFYQIRTYFQNRWLAFPAVLKHLCAVAQSFLKEKVRGNAERLKYWEMSRSRKNGLGFAKQFCGREDSQNRD